MLGLTKKLAGWAAGRLKGEKARQKTMDWMEKTGVGQLISGAGDAAILGGAGKLAGAGLKAAGAKLGIGKGAATLPSGDLPARKGFLGIGKRAQMTPSFDAAGNITGYSPVTDPMASLARDRASQIPGLPISDAARNESLKAALEKAQGGIAGNILEREIMNPIPGMEQFGGAIKQAPAFGGKLSQMVQQNAADYIGRNPTMMERAGSALRGAGGMAQRAGSALMRKPEIAAAGLNAYTTARQGTLNREVQREAAAQRAKEFEQTFGQSEAERKREIERQQRIAQMLAPLFQRIAGGQG